MNNSTDKPNKNIGTDRQEWKIIIGMINFKK